MELPKSLKDIPFEYIQGLRFDDGAERVYVNKEYGIQVNIETPFNKRTNKWGKGKRSYSLINSEDGKFFDSYAELLKQEQGNDT